MNMSSYCGKAKIQLPALLRTRPQAAAAITGSERYPGISGIARFYQSGAGVIVYAEISGLPCAEKPCGERIFGFHIHTGSGCGGTGDDPFANAKAHYNPEGCEHPYHAGDMPPLFGTDGLALSLFLTGRFTIDEIICRSIIIHDRPDDFTSQPSGNAGEKIACGVIKRVPGSCR